MGKQVMSEARCKKKGIMQSLTDIYTLFLKKGDSPVALADSGPRPLNFRLVSKVIIVTTYLHQHARVTKLKQHIQDLNVKDKCPT